MTAGMNGEIGVGPVTADINVAFSDILDHVDAGMMGSYVAKRGPLSIGVDVIYLNLEAEKALDAESSAAARG